MVLGCLEWFCGSQCRCHGSFVRLLTTSVLARLVAIGGLYSKVINWAKQNTYSNPNQIYQLENEVQVLFPIASQRDEQRQDQSNEENDHADYDQNDPPNRD